MFREELNAFAFEHLSSSECLAKTFVEAEISEKDVMVVGERFGIGTADKVLSRVQSALS